MINLLKKIYRNTISRMVFTVVMCMIFIGCGFGFLINEMIQNRVYYIRHYTEQQQDITNQLSETVKVMVGQNTSLNEIKDTLISNEINGSYRWCFFGIDNQLIQAKDENSLIMLNRNKVNSLSKLNQWLEFKNEVVTKQSFTYNGKEYTVGIMSSRANVIQDSKISKHSTYVMMAVALLCIVFFVSIVFLLQILNRRDRLIEKLRSTIVENDKQIEKASQEILTIENEYAVTDENTTSIYQSEMFSVLIDKSNRPELYPLSIVCVKLVMSNRYYKKDEMHAILNCLKEKCSKKYVLAELSKGVFVFVLYKTTKEETIAFKKQIVAQLKDVLPQYGMKCKVGYEHAAEIKNENTARIIYQKLMDKMKNKGTD